MLRYLLSLLFLLSLVSGYAAKIVDLLPDSSCVMDGYLRADVEQRLSSGNIHDIEGIWSFVDDGSIMAIERFTPENLPDNNNTCYRMVVIKSPMRALAPGTLMGYISPTAKKGTYDASIFTEFDGLRGLHKQQRFYLVLDDDGLLSFNRYREGLQLNLWRFLPYMFRYTVKKRSERPKGLDGCRRIYPAPASVPFEPRYL